MSNVAVNVSLTAPQRETLAEAAKASSLKVNIIQGNLVLTEDNILTVRAAVVKHFRSKFARKTKDAELLKTCFNCERIIDKIDDRLYVFGIKVPTTSDDDNAPAIVDINEEEVKAKLVKTIAAKPEEETDGD